MAVKSKGRLSKKKRKKQELRSDRFIAAIIAVIIIAGIISALVASNSDKSADVSLYDFGKSVAQGIDVSEHNGEIDWDAVADEFDFAFIRAGYRGYGNGEIVEDKYFEQNIKAAIDSGIPVGVYFYSQAVSKHEAKQEADFLLDRVKGYDISLPLVIDFEYPTDEFGSRTGRLSDAGLSADDNTDIINAFCRRVTRKGYAGCVYASSSVLRYDLNLGDIDENTVIWAADYNDSVTHGVEYDIWQYSKTGSVSGVSSKFTDLNYWYSSRKG